MKTKPRYVLRPTHAAAHEGLKASAQALTAAGIKDVVFYASSGTAHEWQTWRRSLHEFAPRLFK